MAKIFKKPYEIKQPKSKTEFEEFGPGKSGVQICRRCLCFYYKKSWHHRSPVYNWNKRKEEVKLNFAICPACRQSQNHMYEGEIKISNIPKPIQNELVNLITAYGKRAYEEDCQHRLIIVSKRKDFIRITTTENQLAVKLSKKIKDTFKKLNLHIAYSHEEDDVERTRIEFIEK